MQSSPELSMSRYAPTPDGQRFLIVEDVFAQERTPLELVLNWMSGLER